MTSLIKYCMLLFILTGNCSSVDALLKKYASLISDVHKYYGTSSVFFIFSRNDWHLQEHTLANFICLEFSKKGIFTLMIDYDKLNTGNNFYKRRIVRPLIVVVMKSVNDIVEFNEYTHAMNKAYPIWLIIFVDEFSKTLCEYCKEPTGNTFSLRFDTEMLIVCCHNPVLQEWWSIHENRTEIADFARWSKNEGLTLLVMRGLYDRRYDLKGAGLRVAIVTSSTLNHDYGHTIGGFGGTLLQELQWVMNFTISETIRDMRYGSWSSITNSWSGVVGQVARGEADIGIGEFTITNERRTVIEFTLPLMISRTRLYMRVPDGSEVQWYSYIEVFRFEIWITLIILLITTPILLTAIKGKKGSTPLSCLIIENYLHVWGIFCQEGVSQFPSETPLRIAYISIFISALVVSAAYSASLISFLTVSSASLPFSTLAGFANDKSYKLIVAQNTSDYDLFASSTDLTLKKMMTLMKPWRDLPRTLEEGFEQVCTEKAAFFTDEIVKKTVDASIHCKLEQIDSGSADYLALILSPSSQYTGIVNYHIQRLQENGLLNQLMKKYFREENTKESSYPVVRFGAIVPILSVLAGGTVLACIMLFCEKIYDYKRANAQRWPSNINKMRARSYLSSEAPLRNGKVIIGLYQRSRIPPAISF